MPEIDEIWISSIKFVRRGGASGFAASGPSTLRAAGTFTAVRDGREVALELPTIEVDIGAEEEAVAALRAELHRVSSAMAVATRPPS